MDYREKGARGDGRTATRIYREAAGYGVPMESGRTSEYIAGRQRVLSRSRAHLSLVGCCSRACEACGNGYRICRECCRRICHQPNDPWKFRLPRCDFTRARSSLFFFYSRTWSRARVIQSCIRTCVHVCMHEWVHRGTYVRVRVGRWRWKSSVVWAGRTREEKAAVIPEPSILKLILNDSDARWNVTDWFCFHFEAIRGSRYGALVNK